MKNTALHKRLSASLASCLAALLLCASAHAAPKPVPITPHPPRPLPAIAYRDAQGELQTLDAAQAKLTVLHFWATWCVPCVEELPQLDRVAQAYAEKGLRVLPLSLDGAKADRVRDFYGTHGLKHLPAAYDEKQAVLKATEGKVLPLSVFINARGEIIARADGVVAWQDKETREFLEKRLE